MAGAAISAILGLAGTGYQIANDVAGTRTGSMSTLSPVQQLYMAQMIGAFMPKLDAHYKNLADAGASPKSSYDSLSNSDYYGKVQLPSMNRQKQTVAAMNDPYHPGASEKIASKVNELSQLGRGSLRATMGQRDRQMKQQAQDDAYSRQLQALSGMTGNWNIPLVQNRENYMTQKVDPIALGVSGAAALSKGIGSIYDLAQSGGSFSLSNTGFSGSPGNTGGGWTQE